METNRFARSKKQVAVVLGGMGMVGIDVEHGSVLLCSVLDVSEPLMANS